MSDLFNPGDRVDITIPDAEVIDHGASKLTITLAGLDGTLVLPTRDNRAREVLAVVRAVPRIRPGELYTVAGQPDRRLFAIYNPIDGAVQLVDPQTGEWHWPAKAVDTFGALHLSVPMPDPEPAIAVGVAKLPILQGPVEAEADTEPAQP